MGTGFLAFVDSPSDNRYSKAWIFIIEGIMTVVAGFFSFRYVYDFPAEAKFLTAEEKAMVASRLRSDQGATGEVDFHRSHLISAVTDWKVSKTLLVVLVVLTFGTFTDMVLLFDVHWCRRSAV